MMKPGVTMKKKRGASHARIRIGTYKTVFKGLLFEIQQAKARLPSGKTEVFERAIRHQDSVTILAFDAKKRILLTREYRLNRGGRYMLRLPGGRIDRGEAPIKAAQRELREETGFRAKKLVPFHVSDMGQSLQWRGHAYLATGLVRDPLPKDEGEDITVIPTSLREAFRLAKTGAIEHELMAYFIMRFYHSIF